MPSSNAPNSALQQLEEALAEAQLCDLLEKRITITGRTIYNIKPLSALISRLEDGTPVAQLVCFEKDGIIVLVEAKGVPPPEGPSDSEARSKGASSALLKLLDLLQSMWGLLCGVGKVEDRDRQKMFLVPYVLRSTGAEKEAKKLERNGNIGSLEGDRDS